MALLILVVPELSCGKYSLDFITPAFVFICDVCRRKSEEVVKDVYSLVFLPPVGWSRTSSRLCRTTKRDPDAVAPLHSQTLPHTALWVLQPRHAGRGGRRPAELGRRELEGMASSLQYKRIWSCSKSLENHASVVLSHAILTKMFRRKTNYIELLDLES